MINVVASYSRKLQFEYYGGNKFEGSDHFASLGRELPDDSTQTSVEEAYQQLYGTCKRMVLSACADEMEEIKDKTTTGMPWNEFGLLYKDFVRGVPLQVEAFERLNDHQKFYINEAKLLLKRNAYEPKPKTT